MPKITLRLKQIFTPIEKVYAYDPWLGTVLIKLGEHHGQLPGLESVSDKAIEAIADDPQGTYHDVIAELRKRAGEIINDQLT